MLPACAASARRHWERSFAPLAVPCSQLPFNLHFRLFTVNVFTLIANNMVYFHMLSSRNARASALTGQASPDFFAARSHQHLRGSA